MNKLLDEKYFFFDLLDLETVLLLEKEAIKRNLSQISREKRGFTTFFKENYDKFKFYYENYFHLPYEDLYFNKYIIKRYSFIKRFINNKYEKDLNIYMDDIKNNSNISINLSMWGY
jgi:hypothetical protein